MIVLGNVFRKPNSHLPLETGSKTPNLKYYLHIRSTYNETTHLSIEFVRLVIIPRESLLGMGDVKSTIRSSFHRGEHLGASRGTGQTSVQAASNREKRMIAQYSL